MMILFSIELGKLRQNGLRYDFVSIQQFSYRTTNKKTTEVRCFRYSKLWVINILPTRIYCKVPLFLIFGIDIPIKALQPR